jgi:oligosaccharide repeat unit polymerase
VIYYAVLAVATLLITILGVAIWANTRSIAFVFGLGFIVYDLRGGNSGFLYDYLYYKLFPIHLDPDYLWTLILYSTFILCIELAVLFSARPKTAQVPIRPIRISHTKMLLIAIVSGALSFWIVKDTFTAAASQGLMAYHFVYEDSSISRFFTLHQIFDRICVFTTTIGLAISFSGSTAKYIVGRGSRTHRALYLVVLAGIFAMNLMLGFRNILVSSFLTSIFFYLVNARRVRKFALVAGCVIIILAVGLVGLTRGVAVSDTVLELGVAKAAVSALVTYAMSNEPFAAHMSMYGSLHKGIELTYGSSVVALITSIIPRILWLNRPEEISLYYAYEVGGIEGQGYTIHHAAGWYLNFGTAGVVFGAVLFGWLWGILWKQFQEAGGTRSYWRRLFRAIAFWSFTAGIPAIVRTGPEGYKAIFLETLLIPTLILGFSGSRLVMKFNRPRLLFGDDSLSVVARTQS